MSSKSGVTGRQGGPPTSDISVDLARFMVPSYVQLLAKIFEVNMATPGKETESGCGWALASKVHFDSVAVVVVVVVVVVAVVVVVVVVLLTGCPFVS
jgi:hypothetical protein